jgi:hypothetical protein
MTLPLTSPVEVRLAALRHLADGAVHPLAALADAIGSDGLVLGPDPEARLEEVLDDVARLDWIGEAAVVDVPAAAAGIAWCRPLDPDLAAEGLVALDVAPLSPGDVAAFGELPLADGTGRLDALISPDDAHPWVPDGGAIVGPSGWLDAVAGGAVVTFTTRAPGGDLLEGAVEVGGLPDVPEVPVALADAVRVRMAERWAEHADAWSAEPAAVADAPPPPFQADDLLLDVLLSDRAAFGEVVPPLDRVLDAAGLSVYGDFVAPDGYDWELRGEGQRLAFIAHGWRLDEVGVASFELAEGLLAAWRAGAEVDLEGTAMMFASPGVALAFDAESCEAHGADVVLPFLVAVVDAAAGGRIDAGAPLAAALVAERLGQVDEMERLLDLALRWDPERPEALHEKAWFVSDRGDAVAALRLLRRAGTPDDDPDVQLLTGLTGRHKATVGRNDPCPCGSGRKYKQCHLGRTDLSLGERTTWLYRKACQWLAHPRWQPAVVDVAWARGGGGMASERLIEHDPFVADAVLSEDGLWHVWLDERGALLPEDELALAGEWGRAERSLFEVQAVASGASLTLHDLRTDAVVEVTEQVGSTQIGVGEILLARPVPDGAGGLELFGGVMRIAETARDGLLELLATRPSGLELAAFLHDLDRD